MREVGDSKRRNKIEEKKNLESFPGERERKRKRETESFSEGRVSVALDW